MIAVFISNKLVSTDTIVPLLFELRSRYDDAPIRLYTTNRKTYEIVRENRVLWDAIGALGALAFIGARNRSTLGRVGHRLAVLPLLAGLALRALAGRLTLIHFGVLNEWPLRALYIINRRRTFLFQAVPVGQSKTEVAIDNLVRVRSAFEGRLAASAVVAFQDDWRQLVTARQRGLAAFVHRPTQNLRAWTEFTLARAGDYFEDAFRTAGVAPAEEILAYMLGYFGRLDFLSGEDVMTSLFHETVDALVAAGGGRPIFIKPHAITDLPTLDKLLAQHRGAPVVVTALHPNVLASRARLFVANYYSTTLYTARLLSVPTIEYTSYNTKAMAATGGSSMRAEAVSYFVNRDPVALSAAIAACVSRPREHMAVAAADPALLAAMAGRVHKARGPIHPQMETGQS